jgi:hypothetical protein
MKISRAMLFRIVVIALLFLGIISAIVLTPSVYADSQLYEHYNASWFDVIPGCGDIWIGQTFTAMSNHTVNAVRLHLARSFCGPGEPCIPGIIYVIIKQLSTDGNPEGAVLSSGRLDGNTLPVGYSWQWAAMTEYNLQANTSYAIILYTSGPCPPSLFGWLIQDGNPYPEGNVIGSPDGGQTWFDTNMFDFNFEVWGGPIPPVYNNYSFLDSSSSSAEQQIFSLPADIKVLNMSSQPNNATAGQPIKIMANVVNRGDLPGSFEAVLKINNSVETTRQITVPAHEAVPLEFTVLKENPGNYTAELNGQHTYFSITADNKNRGVDTRSIAWALLGILILSTVVVFIKYLTSRY